MNKEATIPCANCGEAVTITDLNNIPEYCRKCSDWDYYGPKRGKGKTDNRNPLREDNLHQGFYFVDSE